VTNGDWYVSRLFFKLEQLFNELAALDAGPRSTAAVRNEGRHDPVSR